MINPREDICEMVDEMTLKDVLVHLSLIVIDSEEDVGRLSLLGDRIDNLTWFLF